MGQGTEGEGESGTKNRRRRGKLDMGPEEKGNVGQGTEGEGESGTKNRRRRGKWYKEPKEKGKVVQGTKGEWESGTRDRRSREQRLLRVLENSRLFILMFYIDTGAFNLLSWNELSPGLNEKFELCPHQ